MSPILVRPVREQLEHDRVIRLLQAKYKRKFDVAINPGHQQLAPVGPPAAPWYPDLVLHSNERGRRLAGVVEVETAESVNNLEAMSQWVAFSKQRADFHLYVPASSIDVARRLCSDNGIEVAEFWAYHAVGDQVRFVLVQRAPGATAERSVLSKPVAKAAKSAQVTSPKAASSSPKGSKPASAASPAKVTAAKPTAAKTAAPKAPAVKAQAAPKGDVKRPAAKAVAKSGGRAVVVPSKPPKAAPKAKAASGVKSASKNARRK